MTTSDGAAPETAASETVAAGRAFPETTPRDHDSRLADPDRLISLRAAGLEDALGDPAMQRVTRLASRLVGAPVSLLWLIEERRQVLASAVGLPDDLAGMTETPLSHSLCQYVVASGRPLEIDDARGHPLLKSNGSVVDMNVVAYIGHPVRSPDGQIIGSFCAIDMVPHVWTDDDRQALGDLAAMVESEMRLRQQVARGDLLTQELDHRVRNLFTVATGMVRLSLREAGAADGDGGDGGGSAGGAARLFADRLTGRLSALAEAHRMGLPRQGGQPQAGVRLGDLVERILRPYLRGGENPVTGPNPEVTVLPQAVTYMALGLHELATNAVKYGGLAEGGTLTVGWRQAGDGGVAIDWVETGAMKMGTVRTGATKTGAGTDAGAEGFGSTLLRNAFEAGLGGRIDRRRVDGRFVVTVTVPQNRLSAPA